MTAPFNVMCQTRVVSNETYNVVIALKGLIDKFWACPMTFARTLNMFHGSKVLPQVFFTLMLEWYIGDTLCCRNREKRGQCSADDALAGCSPWLWFWPSLVPILLTWCGPLRHLLLTKQEKSFSWEQMPQMMMSFFLLQPRQRFQWNWAIFISSGSDENHVEISAWGSGLIN